MSSDVSSVIDSLKKVADEYLSFLLNKDRHSAESLIRKQLERGVSIRDVYLYVFQQVQWEIGRLWELNKISVAMEHYCTAATQFIMSRLYDHIFTTNKIGRSMVATSVSGELHELGIRMVSDFFEMEGWDTYYLGSNSPHNSVISMLRETRAHVMAISATIYFNIPEVTDLIKTIKAEDDLDKVKIMVGGKPFNTYKDLYKEVNADYYARNAQEAIGLANSLFEKKP